MRLNACEVDVWWAFTVKKSIEKQGFIERVIDRSGQDRRRLQLLFVSDADKSWQVK